VEPYVALPERRMRTVERLAAAGLDVGINVAPFLPGLTEHDLDTLLHRAADAGATRAWTTMLRLPGSVKEVFASRLRERLPLTAEKTLARIRDARGGGLNDPRFHSRFRGTGPYADSVARMFRGLVKKHGLDGPPRARPVQPTPFRRPQAQLSLL
jgi:DNA repair photolyase